MKALFCLLMVFGFAAMAEEAVVPAAAPAGVEVVKADKKAEKKADQERQKEFDRTIKNQGKALDEMMRETSQGR